MTSLEMTDIKTALRRIVQDCARLDVPLEELADDDSLFDAGLQSQATVHLLIAIEDEFGVEIPDRMLTRALFTSIDSMADSIAELRGEISRNDISH
jgi:acyl carrier protein